VPAQPGSASEAELGEMGLRSCVSSRKVTCNPSPSPSRSRTTECLSPGGRVARSSCFSSHTRGSTPIVSRSSERPVRRPACRRPRTTLAIAAELVSWRTRPHLSTPCLFSVS
jgi:hypothetical protein